MSVCEIHAKAVKRKFNLKGLVNITLICFIILRILLSWQLAFLGSLKFWVVSQTENAVEKMLPFHSCLYGMSGETKTWQSGLNLDVEESQLYFHMVEDGTQ